MLFGFYGVCIIPKWLIPDRLQYFLDDFWNFQKIVKIWTRGPINYYQNTPKIQNKYGIILERIIFIYDNLKVSKILEVLFI